MKLRTRITTVLLLCGLVPLIVAGFISYRTASSSLTTVQTESSDAIRAKVISGLDAQRDLKKAQITAYFDSIRDQMLTFSEDQMVVDAMKGFSESFGSRNEELELDDEAIATLRNELRTYYSGEFTAEFKNQNNGQSPNAEQYLAQLDDESIALQHAYIRANKNPLGSKHELDRSQRRHQI